MKLGIYTEMKTKTNILLEVNYLAGNTLRTPPQPSAKDFNKLKSGMEKPIRRTLNA